MNAIVFGDDSQIVELRCAKRYGAKAETLVRVACALVRYEAGPVTCLQTGELFQEAAA